MPQPLLIVAASPDADRRTFFATALTRLGHQVRLARTGRELLEVCRLVAPDLVVVDVDLDEPDGMTASDAVCRHRPVPVLLVADGVDPAGLERAVANRYATGFCPRSAGEDGLAVALVLARQGFEAYRTLEREVAALRREVGGDGGAGGAAADVALPGNVGRMTAEA